MIRIIKKHIYRALGVNIRDTVDEPHIFVRMRMCVLATNVMILLTHKKSIRKFKAVLEVSNLKVK